MPQQPPPVTVRELVERYMESRENKIAHPSSLRSHAKEIMGLWGDETLDHICQRGVLRDMCINFNHSRSDLARATIRKKLIIFQSALRWAWKQQWIDGLPVMFIPEEGDPVERELSAEDRAALLSATDSYPTEPHIRTFVYLALYTKQPRGKILEMKWEQVNFEKNQVHFFARDLKKIVIKLHPKLREVLLRAHDAKRTDFVVEWRGKQVRSVYQGFTSLTQRAGLNIDTYHLRLGGDVEETPEFDETSPYFFISYCSDDGRTQANALVSELEQRGQRCFIAPRDMKDGKFAGQLTRAIQEADKFVLIMTPEANESAHVLQEVIKAFKSKKTFVVVKVGRVEFGDDLDHYASGNQEYSWTTASKVAQQLLPNA